MRDHAVKTFSSTFCLINPLCPVWVRPPPLSRRIDPPLQPSRGVDSYLYREQIRYVDFPDHCQRLTQRLSVKKPTNSPKSKVFRW